MFQKGQSIPQRQLMMEWKGEGTPVRLVYKIVLKETRPSNDNFLFLVLDPAEGIHNSILNLVTVLLLVPFLCEAKLAAKIKPEIVPVMLLLTFEPFDIL